MKQLQDQGGFDNQKLILLELLDLATPHLPEGFEAIARAITFTLPLLWTELKRGTAMHCKIHCALSFRSSCLHSKNRNQCRHDNCDDFAVVTLKVSDKH